MTPQQIADHVPIGSVVEFYDGTPRPPPGEFARFAAWRRRNAVGLLTHKRNGIDPSITLYAGEMDCHGNVRPNGLFQFRGDVDLQFEVMEEPRSESILVATELGEGYHVQFEAMNMRHAKAWAAENTPHRPHFMTVAHGGMLKEFVEPEVARMAA